MSVTNAILNAGASDSDFFRALAETIPQIVFTATAAGQLEYLNGRWYRYTGQHAGDERDGGHLDCLHPDDRARVVDECGAIYAAQREGYTEARYRRADGAYRWHRVTFAPFRLDGAIVRWFGTITDVHAQRLAERSFRTLARTLPILVWTAQADGSVDFFNERWRERVADIDALLGSGWYSIVHPDDVSAVAAAWKRTVSSGDDYLIRVRLRMRSGAYRWHEATALPERDENGAIVRWYGAAVDVDEGVVLRETLRDNDVVTRLLRELAQRTPTLLFTAAPSGRIDFVNDRWAELLSTDPRVLLGAGWMRFVHGDDLAAIKETLRAHARTGQPYVGQWRFKRSNQAYRWVEIRAEPQWEDGRIVRWFGAGIDIDTQRRAIDALHLLAESVADTAAAGNIDVTLSRLAQASLAGVADVSVFDLFEHDGTRRRIVVGAPNVAESELTAVKGYDVRRNLVGWPLTEAADKRRTIHLPVIDDAFLAAHIEPGERRAAWVASGVRSMIVAPLVVGDRALGTLTLLRTLPGMPFDRQDVRVLEEIAHRSAIAAENIRLSEVARAAIAQREERFHQIADAIPQLMWVADEAGRVEWVNARWLEFTGQHPEAALAEGWRAVVHPDDESQAHAAWRIAAATLSTYECEFRLRARDGRFRWFLGRATPFLTGEGTKWYGTNTDIDDARRAARTMRVFADIGEALSESLGLKATLDAVMQVVVPEYADWAFITLLDEARDLRVAAIYHDDPAISRRLGSLIGKVYARGDRETGSPAAIRSREPILYARATYDDGARVIEPDVIDAFWRIAAYDSVLVIPLIVGSTARGTLTLCMASGRRAFDANDVPFFMEIGRRITPAIANAELYERERRVAQSFQEAALPAALPAAEGYVFSAIYEAGRAEALVGGDWYDAFSLLDGRIVVSIGDVAGSGLRAAVTMANIRQAIRGVAHVHADPELMLEAADRALRTDIPDSFATAFVGVIDPVDGTLSYKSAGHPAALLRSPSGELRELLTGGLPLGIRQGEREPPQVVALGAGSVLYLYTDGLIESTHDMLEGERRLRAAVERTRDADPRAIAGLLYRDVLVDGSRDDVAILSVSVGAPAARRRWVFDARDGAATARVRAEILAALAFEPGAAVQRHAAEMILAEIVGNLARYAPADVEVVLVDDGGRNVMHVRDTGPGFEFLPKLPPDMLSESGRGLFLISKLAAEFNVTRRPDRGSHMRVVFAASG